MRYTCTLITALLFTIVCGAQEKFEYDINGLNTFEIVKSVDSLSKERLFKKTINFIKEYYQNPDEVINTTIENEKIRFSGVRKNGLSYKALGISYFVNVRYTIEVEFKDGRYKFNVLSLEQYVPTSQYSSGGWNRFPLNDGSYLYKKSGKLKKITRNYPEELGAMFNTLLTDLHNYLSKNQSVNKSDW